MMAYEELYCCGNIGKNHQGWEFGKGVGKSQTLNNCTIKLKIIIIKLKIKKKRCEYLKKQFKCCAKHLLQHLLSE